MIRLLEDDAKAWLRAAGLPVPRGASAATREQAALHAADFAGPVVVKALVPAGRRGKAGAVLHAASPAQASAAARDLLGRDIAGHIVREVYVEEAIAIARELYCAFVFDDHGPRMALSAQGGVDIEASVERMDGALVISAIDPVTGMPPWRAIDLWRQAGIRGSVLRALGTITAQLHALFVAGDAEVLEANPLAMDETGRVVVVGAMAGIDASALMRQPQWRSADARVAAAAAANPREQAIAAIDAALPGPECRYVELDGDIGLLVGGGGAGLYLHDRVLESGGRPANHSVTPPTGADNRKLRAVIEAILGNPAIRGLLVGFNFAQMARADLRVNALVDVLDAKGIDTARFPIVIRLFGAGEAEARARVAERPGIHYLTRDASLDDAVRLIVALTRNARAAAAA